MSARSLRRLAGLAALLLYLVMLWIGAKWFRPLVPGELPPQAQAAGYDTLFLSNFAVAVHKAELAGLYRTLLLIIDPLFILGFSVWSYLSLRKLGWIAVALIAAYAGAEIMEGALLVRDVAGLPIGGAGWVLHPPTEGTRAVASYATSVKFVLAVLILALVIGRRLSRRVK